MNTIYERKQVELDNGSIVLYQRADTQDLRWQAKIILPGKGTKRRSTGTPDLEDAKEKARAIKDDLKWRQRKGVPYSDIRWKKAAAAWISHLKEEVRLGNKTERQAGNQERIVRRWLLPNSDYTGNPLAVRYLSEINNRTIVQWRHWRQGQRDKHSGRLPTEFKLNDELGCIRGIFRYAVSQDWIKEAEIPTIKNLPERQVARPEFSEAEWSELCQFMRGWVEAPQKNKKKLQAHIIHSRQLCRTYALVMANSGLRNGEMRYLKFKDVRWLYNEDIRDWECHISVPEGKTGKRTVVAMPKTYKYVTRWRDWKGSHNSDDDYVWSDRKGRLVYSPDETFKSLLKASGLEYNDRGERRSLYSLRHTYATFRIILGHVDVYQLAENMGTSVAQIENHYGHHKSTQVSAQLTRVTRTNGLTQDSNEDATVSGIDYKAEYEKLKAEVEALRA